MDTEFHKNGMGEAPKNYSKYIIIILTIVLLVKYLDISIVTLIAIIFGYYIIKDYKKEEDKVEEHKKEIRKKKQDIIRPKPRKLQNYDDILELMANIQDLYVYNPPSYEEVVDNIDSMLIVYEESKILPELAGINYSIMERKKHNALNSLHSIIYKLPAAPNMVNKHTQSMKKLEKILDKYLYEIYSINQEIIMKEGYKNTTKVINFNGPKEFNFYEKTNYTYDFY